MSNYNGWTNYATWRVNLEIFDGLDDISYNFAEKPEIYEAATWAKEYATEVIEMDSKEGLALDYARAFLDGVNWHEIAEHLIEYAEDCDGWVIEEEQEEELA